MGVRDRVEGEEVQGEHTVVVGRAQGVVEAQGTVLGVGRVLEFDHPRFASPLEVEEDTIVDKVVSIRNHLNLRTTHHKVSRSNHRKVTGAWV